MANHWQIVKAGKVQVSNTAEGLWMQACDYFQWSDDNPVEYKRTLTSGKEAGTKVPIEAPRPYSIKALCLHCGITEEYLRDIRNSKDKNSMYYAVVSKIMYIIYVQNAELATVGVFNPIFTAKVLNLETDDTPVSAVRVEVIGMGTLPQLSKSESEVLEKLKIENGEVRKVE